MWAVAQILLIYLALQALTGAYKNELSASRKDAESLDFR